MSEFTRRALRKAREHLHDDKTGWSLLRYALRWLSSRTGRKIAISLQGPRPTRFTEMPPDKAMVAVKVTGGVGDHVIIARVLRDLGSLSDSIRFHVFCSSVHSGEWAFGGLPCVEAVFDAVFFSGVQKQYDCAMHMNQYVYYQEEDLNLGRLMRLAPALARTLAHCRKTRKQWDVFIDRQPTLDGAFAHTAVALGENRYSFLYSQLGMAPGSVEMDLPCDYSVAQELSSRLRQWVTINTGFDTNFIISSRLATKCYPLEHWKHIVRGLKRQYPDVAVVQIGGKTSVPLQEADVNLIGATSLAQAAAVIRRSLLHVDNEGGLVHIAASLGVRSVVLFGPTPVGYFGYPGNVNLSSGFCGDCWWTTERWMERCPRGYESPKCLEELDPARVLEAVVDGIRCARQDNGRILSLAKSQSPG